MSNNRTSAPFNRATGLIVLEVRQSNPNGDPDQESDPRTLEADGRGVISPVSFKRKLRDLVLDDGDVMAEARSALRLGADGDPNEYGILEARGRDRGAIEKMNADEFNTTFWDARVFGNTFLESMKDKAKDRDVSHFISTGMVQVGVGLSIAPVDIDRMTNTNKAGVEEGKDRGMAPLGFRVVRHGVYTIPFFVNPSMAARNGTTEKDIELFKFLIPYSYPHTASAVRPFVSVLHAWYAEHQGPLGSCSDGLLIDALAPVCKDRPDQPSNSLGDYEIPTNKDVPETLRSRLSSLKDLAAGAPA
ncbi:MAG: type I CRISPR-associated protein Cas7 [Phycisphaerae bacterium]|nr:type I CRISPR-associated protein Cas7 [Phycisphaerae bacterium]